MNEHDFRDPRCEDTPELVRDGPFYFLAAVVAALLCAGVVTALH